MSVYKPDEINANDWFEEVRPKNGPLKLYWAEDGLPTTKPSLKNKGYGLRYLWYYKNKKRLEGFSRSWFFNPVWKDPNLGDNNNGPLRFLAQWKNPIQIDKEFHDRNRGWCMHFYKNGLPSVRREFVYFNEEWNRFNDLVLDIWTPDGKQVVRDGNGTFINHAPIVSQGGGFVKCEWADRVEEDFYLPENGYIPGAEQLFSSNSTKVWDNLEWYQGLDLVNLPPRFINYTCEFKNGWKRIEKFFIKDKKTGKNASKCVRSITYKPDSPVVDKDERIHNLNLNDWEMKYGDLYSFRIT